MDGLMVRDPAGKELTRGVEGREPNEVELTLPLQNANPAG